MHPSAQNEQKASPQGKERGNGRSQLSLGSDEESPLLSPSRALRSGARAQAPGALEPGVALTRPPAGGRR